jgi:hypothetical protein
MIIFWAREYTARLVTTCTRSMGHLGSPISGVSKALRSVRRCAAPPFTDVWSEENETWCHHGI